MLNKMMLAGRICKDPELKYTQANKAILRFLMAIEGRDKSTMWVNCVVFHDKTIEIFKERLNKGTPVAVTGRLDPRTYEGKQYFDLSVDMFGLEVMEAKQQPQQPQQQNGNYQQPQQPQQQYNQGNQAAAAAVNIDDIPF